MVTAVSTNAGTGRVILPFFMGLVAQRSGLSMALWLLTVALIAILLGLPRVCRSGDRSSRM